MAGDDPLKRSLSLRMPVFDKGTAPKLKIEALEEYMLLSAFVQGELAEERVGLEEDIADKQQRWASLQTTSTVLGKKATEAQIERERWEEEPELGRDLKRLQRRIRHLSEEEGRMERDAKVASRAYTFITGGA